MASYQAWFRERDLAKFKARVQTYLLRRLKEQYDQTLRENLLSLEIDNNNDINALNRDFILGRKVTARQEMTALDHESFLLEWRKWAKTIGIVLDADQKYSFFNAKGSIKIKEGSLEQVSYSLQLGTNAVSLAFLTFQQKLYIRNISNAGLFLYAQKPEDAKSGLKPGMRKL